MAQADKWHNLKGASALCKYAEPRLKRETDRKVFRSIQTLEIQQDGLCKDVVANFRTIARCAKVDLSSVGRVLKRLEGYGLIELTIGSRDYAERKATRMRRYTVEELKRHELENSPAKKLERILSKRPIQYGAETVQPSYKVATTNRLYASKPNVQGSKGVRGSRLAMNCKEEQVLFELDFKAAEPAIISQAIGYEQDGYAVIAEAEGIERGAVKKIFNRIVYARASAVKAAHAHGIKSAEALQYFGAVDEFRKQLRYPNGKPVRQTATLRGTIIEATQGKKVHNGTLLSYHAQGTVADYINKAALDIIGLEKARGWEFVAPCHDAVYVAATPEQVEELRNLVEQDSGQETKINQTPNPREYG